MKHTSLERGYTLLEMIVAVGIFSLIMLTATGAYLKLIDLDRRARATNELVTGLSFAVDSMSRAARTGTCYECDGGTNCTNGTSFEFRDADGRAVVLSRSNNQLVETVDGTVIPLTDPRISVNSLNFIVRGVGIEGGTKIQPQAIFTMQGSLVTGQGKTVSFSIEGSATQRVLELAALTCP